MDWSKSTKLISAFKAATLIIEQLLFHAAPATILTDRGKHLGNYLFCQILQYFQVWSIHTNSYHPQTND